ncbi:hypothetical protein HRG_014090 [Hirsutella rhossiliensis]
MTKTDSLPSLRSVGRFLQSPKIGISGRLDLLPLQLLQPLCGYCSFGSSSLESINTVINGCPRPGPGSASCSGPGPGVKRGGFQADLPDRDEDSSKKRKTRRNGCLACKSLGHRLSQCWQVFEENRPEGFNPSKRLQETIQQSLKEDPRCRRKDQETNFQTNAFTAGLAVDQESFVRVMFFTDAFSGMVFPYFLRTYLSKHNWSVLRDFVNWMKSHFGYEKQLERHPFRDQFFQAQKDHLASHEEMGSFEELDQIDAVNAFVNCPLEEEEVVYMRLPPGFQ